MYGNRATLGFDTLQNPQNDSIDITLPCFDRVYPNERLKKVPVRVSRYFCVQSSSDSRSANRPMTVITPRTTFTASIKSPPNQYAYKSSPVISCKSAGSYSISSISSSEQP